MGELNARDCAVGLHDLKALQVLGASKEDFREKLCGCSALGGS